MKKIEYVVNSYLEKNKIDKDEKIYVAFSGGSDSLALLSILSKIMTTPPVAVYVDHNIRSREELDKEIKKNKENCEKLGCLLLIHSLKKGEVEELCFREKITIEAAARILRYSFFDSLDGLVATAHNYDDQVESVFMRLLTGSTFQSLAGIRKRRGKYIRPLLEISKKDIENYCKENFLSYSFDSTNSTLFCLRNRVRHLIIPSINSEIKQTLINISNNVSTFLERINTIKVIDKGFYKILDRNKFLSSIEIEADISILNLVSIFTQNRVSKREIEVIKEAVKNKRSYISNDFIICSTDDEIRIFPPKFYYSSKVKKDMSFMGLRLIKSNSKDALLLPNDDLFIRVNEELDEFEGINGRVKIKDLLSSMKIPYCLVVYSKDEIVGIFATCFGGKNRICKRFHNSDYQLFYRYDVISPTLLEL